MTQENPYNLYIHDNFLKNQDNQDPLEYNEYEEYARAMMYLSETKSNDFNKMTTGIKPIWPKNNDAKKKDEHPIGFVTFFHDNADANEFRTALLEYSKQYNKTQFRNEYWYINKNWYFNVFRATVFYNLTNEVRKDEYAFRTYANEAMLFCRKHGYLEPNTYYTDTEYIKIFEQYNNKAFASDTHSSSDKRRHSSLTNTDTQKDGKRTATNPKSNSSSSNEQPPDWVRNW